MNFGFRYLSDDSQDSNFGFSEIFVSDFEITISDFHEVVLLPIRLPTGESLVPT